MALEPLTTWQSTFADLPLTNDKVEGAQNLADWLGDRLDNLLVCEPVIQGPNIIYTFDRATFATELANLPIVNNPETAAKNIANAWNSALSGTTAVMQLGSSIGPPSNPTLWSSITSTTIDAPSIALGKAKVEELKDANPVKKAKDSDFPIKLREAHLLHTITTVGLDSTPGPSGPLPLTDTSRGVV